MANLPGTRIRDNGVFGAITDNPLTSGSTTFNSPDLADLSVVAGDHALVTLDPLKEFGDPEIVMVTIHTVAATVATIQRGMFGTVARAHPQGTLWVHAATNDDFIRIVTSAARPADPYRGQGIFETDTNRLVSRSNIDTWQQDGLFFDPPACRVFHNTTQSIPNNTLTDLLFNSEEYDTDGMHSTASLTNRITINTPGIYILTSWVQWATDNDFTEVLTRFLIDGTTGIEQARISIAGGTLSGVQQQTNSAVLKLNAGQFVTVNVRQANVSTGANLVGVGSNFTATWIGRGN